MARPAPSSVAEGSDDTLAVEGVCLDREAWSATPRGTRCRSGAEKRQGRGGDRQRRRGRNALGATGTAQRRLGMALSRRQTQSRDGDERCDGVGDAPLVMMQQLR